MIAEIWDVVQAEQLYIPLHHQVLNWGFTDPISVPVSADDTPKFKYFEIN